MHNKDLVYVIAGATSGIAREVIPLLQLDSIVIPLMRHDSPRMPSREAELPSSVVVNLFGNDFHEVEALIADCKRICFINYSATKVDQLFLRQTLHDFRQSFEVNVLSSINILQMLIQKMIAKQWGRIIFISSTTGARGDVGTSSYSCSKASLVGLSGSIGREYARFGITSNVLSLGYFDSPLFNALPSDRKKSLLAAVPSRTLGTSSDVAAAIKMIVECGYFNTRQLNLDGGAD